jgi:hypothetical protein
MIQCECVEKHVPLPTTYRYIKIKEETVTMCPTTFDNVEQLVLAFKLYGGPPPGSVTKHYSKFVREICLSIWKEHNSQIIMV